MLRPDPRRKSGSAIALASRSGEAVCQDSSIRFSSPVVLDDIKDDVPELKPRKFDKETPAEIGRRLRNVGKTPSSAMRKHVARIGPVTGAIDKTEFWEKEGAMRVELPDEHYRKETTAEVATRLAMAGKTPVPPVAARSVSATNAASAASYDWVGLKPRKDRKSEVGLTSRKDSKSEVGLKSQKDSKSEVGLKSRKDSSKSEISEEIEAPQERKRGRKHYFRSSDVNLATDHQVHPTEETKSFWSRFSGMFTSCQSRRGRDVKDLSSGRE